MIKNQSGSTFKLSCSLPIVRSNKVKLFHVVKQCFARPVMMVNSHCHRLLHDIMSLFPEPLLVTLKPSFPFLIEEPSKWLSHRFDITILIPNSSRNSFLLDNTHKFISLLVVKHLSLFLLKHTYLFLRINSNNFNQICNR